MTFSLHRMAIVFACTVILSACGGGKSGGEATSGDAPSKSGDAGEKVLNLYIWSDYLAAERAVRFRKADRHQGARRVFRHQRDARNPAARRPTAGFDIVVPTASYFERQIKAGVYLPLDKTKLPNLKNMDPQLMSKVALHDPDNAHGVIYTWGTNGIGYNEKMIKALLPDAPLDSWRLVFDPAVASKIAKCGISVLDSPAEMLRAVLNYLGARSEFAKARGSGRRRGNARQDQALYPQHQFVRVHRGAGQR